MLLRHGRKLTVHGGGHQRKCYLYVGDAANALNTLLHCGVAGEVYNLGSDDNISIREISATLLNYVNPPGSDSSSEDSNLDGWIQTTSGRPYLDSGSRLDCGKLQALGWRQKVGWEEGLRRTVGWYSAYGETWWGNIGQILGRHS